jgi:alpha-beta hydrolase superfamily lysophospholipase
MGSLVVLDHTITTAGGIAGVLTSGCPIARFSATAMEFAALVTPVLRMIRGPRISNKLEAEELTHYELAMTQYREDPLVVPSVTIRLLTEMACVSRTIIHRANEVRLPCLILHGGEDKIAPPRGSQLLYERLGSSDKQLMIYSDLRHELHNEVPEAAAAFHRLCSEWILERTR